MLTYPPPQDNQIESTKPTRQAYICEPEAFTLEIPQLPLKLLFVVTRRSFSMYEERPLAGNRACVMGL